MKIKKILCPVDFSKYSDSARKFASIFANASKAEIVFLHVASQGAFTGNYDYEMDRARERALSRLVAVKPTIDGIKFSHDVKFCSSIADTIAEYAEEHDFDLIVIPTHGRTGLKRLVLGSVAEAVLRRSKCAVATVRANSDFLKQNPKPHCVAEPTKGQEESEGVS